MNDTAISSLREALSHSPDNIPLRMLLADTLLSMSRLEEAEIEYSTLLKLTADAKPKIGLAHVFFRKANYSACNVILEEVIDNGTNDINAFTLYAKALLKENSTAKAIEVYKRALAVDPNLFDEELDSQLRLRGTTETVESEDDGRFLQKPD